MRVRQFYKHHWLTALIGMAYSVFLYAMLMSHQLTNTFDGLWHQNFHHAGISELTSGRWLLHYLDKLTMGLHADPITSIVALGLFVLGFLLVLELFGVENRTVAILSLLLWCSSTVILNTLSYRMTSIGYAVSYLLAVSSVYAAVKLRNKFLAVGVAGLALGLSMSCYQTYLGVFCVVAVFYLILLCRSPRKQERDLSALLRYVVRIGCAVIVGGMIYVASLTFFLRLNAATLSDYNGAGGITLSGLITGLPENIGKTYRYFGRYYLSDALKLNRLQYFGIFYVLLALLAALLILVGVRAWKTNKRRLLVLVPAALLIPVACNAYMLLAGDKLELQMTAGLAMLLPLTAILAFSCFPARRGFRVPCVLLCLALLYGNSVQAWFDQEAMLEGRNACETMMQQVISDLKDERLLSGRHEYFFVGVPARSPFFAVNESFACANEYAQMGNFWVTGNCAQMSYYGLINKWMGFRLPMSYRHYEDVEAQYDIARMPAFPEEGYITEFDDGMVIIKISEQLPYCDYLYFYQ